jgi:hypothetical protein
MSKLTFQFSFDTETGEFSVVNTDTGEVKTAKVSKKVEVSDNETPTLTLEDTKCVLNGSAIHLLNVEPGDKLDIKYRKKDSIIPVIATDETFGTHSGNKLCKNNSFAYRGSKHDELAKYGTVFTLVKDSEGVFILQGDKIPEPLVEDTPVETDNLDSELENLLNSDSDVTEISDFQFTL